MREDRRPWTSRPPMRISRMSGPGRSSASGRCRPAASGPRRADVAPAPIGDDRLADATTRRHRGRRGRRRRGVCARRGRPSRAARRARRVLRLADLPLDHPRNARVAPGCAPGRSAGRGQPAARRPHRRSARRAEWNANAFDRRRRHARVWRAGVAVLPRGLPHGLDATASPFADWPIGYEDLEPYYDRVEWEIGVCGPGRPAPHDGPRRRGYPMAPLKPNAAQPCSSAAPARWAWPPMPCRC